MATKHYILEIDGPVSTKKWRKCLKPKSLKAYKVESETVLEFLFANFSTRSTFEDATLFCPPYFDFGSYALKPVAAVIKILSWKARVFSF